MFGFVVWMRRKGKGGRDVFTLSEFLFLVMYLKGVRGILVNFEFNEKLVVASVTKDESKLRSALVSNVLVKQGQQVPLLGFCIVPSEAIQLRKGCEITSCGKGEKALRSRIP